MSIARLVLSALLAATCALLPAGALRAHEGAIETPVVVPGNIGFAVVESFRERLDPKRWTVVERPGSGQDTTQPELQYYSPDSVTVDRGALHLSARRVEKLDPQSGKTFAFQSGRVESALRFLYGRVDVRAKLPSGEGFWPAIWLRTPRGGPLTAEIDIVDGFGSRPDAFRSGLVSWPSRGKMIEHCAMVEEFSRPTACERVNTPLALRYDLSRAFHTYGVDWRPASVTWYLDGKPYWQVTKDVPHVPMVLVLDLTVGGPQDGRPTRHTRWPGVLDIAAVTIVR